jgi:hypothetical protein
VAPPGLENKSAKYLVDGVTRTHDYAGGQTAHNHRVMCSHVID